MYDVNYDEFEPVGQPDGGTYSTARPKRKRHVGLAISVSLLVVILCAVMTMISLFTVRVEREAGATSLIFTERRADISANAPETEAPAPPEQTAEEEEPPAVEIRRPGPETMALTEIYSKLEPSVVSVVCEASGKPVERCGIIMSEEGYIITNCRVVRESGPITVLLSNGTEHAASVAGGDPLSDLAVVKIEAEGLVPADFGASASLAVGAQVLSIGDPRGTALRAAMTDGIISCISRDLDVEGRTMTVLQTNANLPAGGYGGPLINMQGQVVGINAENLGTFASSEGNLGLAVPIDDAKNIVDELIEHGYIPGRPSLGASGQSVTATAQAYYRLPAGVYVEELEPNGAAERAGIQIGDIITAIDGMSVGSIEELNLIKNRYKSGDKVTVTLFRNDELMSVVLILDNIR